MRSSLENFKIPDLKIANLVLKKLKITKIRTKIWAKMYQDRFFVKEFVKSWDSGLPPSNKFDVLCLTRAKIFAFEICFENRTNFEEKIQFWLASYIWCWFQQGLEYLCAWIRGSFWLVNFEGNFLGGGSFLWSTF